MRACPTYTLLLFLFVLIIPKANAEGGRGGMFLDLHTASLAAFDPSISGLPLVVGGEGFGNISRNFRLGGGGGGGFLWNPDGETHFAMGYGGIIGEYTFTNWMYVSLLIGGGGYAVSKVTSSTNTTTVVTEVSSGGFIIVQPQVHAEFLVAPAIHIAGSLGLFLPNVAQLQSVTAGISVIFGRG
jgi:hypothetical protein